MDLANSDSSDRNSLPSTYQSLLSPSFLGKPDDYPLTLEPPFFKKPSHCPSESAAPIENLPSGPTSLGNLPSAFDLHSLSRPGPSGPPFRRIPAMPAVSCSALTRLALMSLPHFHRCDLMSEGLKLKHGQPSGGIPNTEKHCIDLDPRYV